MDGSEEAVKIKRLLLEFEAARRRFIATVACQRLVKTWAPTWQKMQALRRLLVFGQVL